MTTKPSKMRVIGHRGSSTAEPENTFSSIRQALEVCDGAEFDVQMTKDNQLVVLHDETLARTAIAWSKNERLSESEYYSLLNTPVTQLNYDDFKDIKIGRYVL
jgi:glycerophosphoryl diester phosphodiesterase